MCAPVAAFENDGFTLVYEGPLHEALISNLFPGETYVFAVQASSEIGTSPISGYAEIQTLPTGAELD